jgi:hypothetical protein
MKLPRRQFLHLAAGAAAPPAMSRVAWAQVYPARPARIIVGFADLLAKYDTPKEFFFAMLKRWPDRRLGATTLWAGTDAIYASRDHEDNDVLADSLNGWFTP